MSHKLSRTKRHDGRKSAKPTVLQPASGVLRTALVAGLLLGALAVGIFLVVRGLF